MTSPLADLSNAGVSLWLDDLSRDRITSGNLQELINTQHIVGVTTNPTIFANALSNGEAYAAQVAELAAAGADATKVIFEATTQDVANACDLFRGIYESSKGYDGRVSIEVEPGLARDTDGTIAQAKELWAKVGRENAMIKIPATVEGLPAITEVIAAGISVNVTLIFSLERYAQVIDAYLSGLEKAKANGVDLSTIHSVASFFVSRVDVEIDKRLDAIGTDAAKALRSKAAIANAQLAFQLFEQQFASDRAQALLAAGANKQRPLWASTGVKDPTVPDTAYVVELVAPGVVNTAPEKTIQAVADHGVVRGDTVTGNYAAAQAVIDGLTEVGIDINEVTDLLEREGVDKFIVSWNELVATVDAAVEAAK